MALLRQRVARRGRARVVGGLAAVARLLALLETEVDEHLAHVDRVPLRREAVVGGDERVRLHLHEVAGQVERAIRLLVRRADVALTLVDPAVRHVVVREVVVVRVRVAVDVRRRHEPRELVLELVRRRRAHEQQVRLDAEAGGRRAEDVLEVRPVGVLPHQALLDVGVLVDDACLHRREVRRRGGREIAVQLLLEVRRAGRAERVVGRVRALHRGEVEAELREVGGQVDRLDVEAGRPARERAGGERQLGVGPLALGEVGNGRGAVLGVGGVDDQHPVVIRGAVVGGVVDVDVPDPVPRDLRVVVREGRLLRRAEGGRHVRPARGVCEVDPLVLHAEGVRARRLPGQVVVEHDPADSDERAEVDDRALKRRSEIAGADPLHGDDRLAAPLGRLPDVVGLQDAGRRKARGVVEVALTDPVERVVRRAVLARPRAGRERVPPDAGVGREALQEAVLALQPSVHQLTHRRHGALLRVLVDQVRPHAVGREEDDRRARGARRPPSSPCPCLPLPPTPSRRRAT